MGERESYELSRKALEYGVMEGERESVAFSEWPRSPKGLELIIDACAAAEYGREE